MGKYPWAKLWIDILDDPKVANMTDSLFRMFIYFMLAAKEYDRDGLLPPLDELAWRIRYGRKEINSALSELATEKMGIIQETDDGWLIINFPKRQEREVSESAERMRRYRDRRVQLGLSKGYTYSHEEIIDRDNNKCVYCGSDNNLCVDHVMPIILGGTDDPENLVAACKVCNSGKAGRTPEQANLKFVNLEAEERYRKYVTVTSDHHPSYSYSDSKSLIKDLNAKPNSKFFTTNDASKAYCQVTGLVSIPSSVYPRLENILDLLQHYGWDETIDRLTKAKNSWISQKNKTNGASYKLTNPAWIDYAITGETLGAPPQLSRAEREQKELEELIRKGQ